MLMWLSPPIPGVPPRFSFLPIAAGLQLPHPTSHGRAAAKTHLPTDENALNQLRQHSPLPSLVLRHRTLQVVSPSSPCLPAPAVASHRVTACGAGRAHSALP